MASRGFWTCRIGRAVGQSLRLFVAGLVAWFAFLFMIDIGNRGFLPSMRRVIWIEGRPNADAWTFRISRDGPVDSLPPAAAPESWTIGLRETSMGRVNGPAYQWRAHNWVPVETLDAASNPIDWATNKDLQTDAFQTSFDRFVRAQVIPASKAVAIWPDDPTDPVQYSRDDNFPSWSVWHHRSRPWILVLISGVALALGLSVALIIRPSSDQTPVPPAR